jgi:hypothetical protein
MRRTAFLALLLLGCQDGPAESPEEAYLRVLKACEKKDSARLFDALDTPTQWSIESVHHAQREMKRLIDASYPPEERDRALARIPACAAEPEERPRRYFRGLDGSAQLLADIDKRMFAGSGQPVGSAREVEGTAEVWRTGGSIFRFARDEKGRWGLSELRAEWEQAKVRAVHDLETVSNNAELYKKRAAVR